MIRINGNKYINQSGLEFHETDRGVRTWSDHVSIACLRDQGYGDFVVFLILDGDTIIECDSRVGVRFIDRYNNPNRFKSLTNMAKLYDLMKIPVPESLMAGYIDASLLTNDLIRLDMLRPFEAMLDDFIRETAIVYFDERPDISTERDTKLRRGIIHYQGICVPLAEPFFNEIMMYLSEAGIPYSCLNELPEYRR